MSRVFEALAAALYEKKELAKPEMDETAAEGDLIAKFYRTRRRPVLTEPHSALRITQLKADSDCYELAVHDRKTVSTNCRVFHFKPTTVAALLAAAVLTIVYVVMLTSYANQKGVNSANAIHSRPNNVPVIEASKRAETIFAKRDIGIVAETDSAPILADLDSVPPPVQSGNFYKTWTVQVSAITSKEVADELMKQLKTAGYDVYVVQAEVKGRIYHRVRIGHFTAREEAEPLRQALSRHEAYRDAYLASD